jgi:hypothetical protein
MSFHAPLKGLVAVEVLFSCVETQVAALCAVLHGAAPPRIDSAFML